MDVISTFNISAVRPFARGRMSLQQNHLPDRVLASLGIPEAVPLLSPHWADSAATLPDSTPDFLTPPAIARNRGLARLAPEADPVLCRVASRIDASAPLRLLAWHCQRLLCRHLDYETAQIRQWPVLDAALGDEAGAFYLLVGLAAIPVIQAQHQKLGIADPISADTCSRLYPEIVGRYRDHHAGRFGVRPGSLYWLRHYIRGDLYRLGRLDYMVRPFNGPLEVFRHRQTRAVVALAADGSWFDGEGLAAAPEAAGAWQANLQQKNGGVDGFPISPEGYAVGQRTFLPLDLWESALVPGEPILDVHIPGGGQMTPERCRDSMLQALEFFPRHFPQRPFKGFACGSWILNPQLGQIYRPDSNMVLWQRELYLYPIPSGDRSGLVFVFGVDEVDPATAPRDTSLRRAFVEHMHAGGRLIAGGMFFLSEDMAHLGTQVYRHHWRDQDLSFS